ncbi:MAG: hypothetical protein JWM33_109 [Caulobacteraceae bacterium]|nr:hypothetical protein [Caulobacteraceae bacterium]
MAILTNWLDRGAEAPERMDAVFRRMATQGVPGLIASARLSPSSQGRQAGLA